MKVALVGPELEENLAVRYIHAAVTRAGHEAKIYDFHAEEQLAHVAMQIAAYGPDAVGLSMMFTARSREFVTLAERLRELGFAGHITAGGHFASFHAERLLEDCAALDSIVHGEGEEAMCELLAHLDDLGAVTGLTWRNAAGAIERTGYRTNLADLDERALPTRPDEFHDYLGMPIASLLAGRGCYGNCRFCSINAWHRQSGGPRFRQRHVEAIAYEMAELYHCRGVRIFNFQDDQFFLPTEKGNLARLGALRDELDGHGVGKIALQVKARPDSVTRPVISLLKDMGLFRVFLGVETNAVVGLETLGRGIQREQNHLALEILREHEVHTCFNLLIFDPESEFEALWENIEFLRRQSYFPLNFCRVEVYAGTAIERQLRDEGRLIGDYYGYTYKIANPRVQLAYEMFREVFSPRNFRVDGMNHQAMRADYYYHLLAHFHGGRRVARLGRQVKGFVGELNRNNAALLSEICRYAQSSPSATAAEQQARTEQLCAARIAFDKTMRPRAEDLIERMRALSEELQQRQSQPPSKVASVAAAALLATTLGCGPKPDTHMAEMAPPDPMRYEPVQLTPAQLQQLTDELMGAYGGALRELFGRHNLLGTRQRIELRLSRNGQVVSARMLDRPQLNSELWKLAAGWRFPGYAQGKARGTISIFFGQKKKKRTDTHMAEMAPRDPRPLPKPAHPKLDQGHAGILNNLIRARHSAQLYNLRAKYHLKQTSARVTIELASGGAVQRIHLLDRGLAKHKRFRVALTRIAKGWKFPRFNGGGKATVVLLLAAPPKIRRDTHMAEMAPPDPTYKKP